MRKMDKKKIALGTLCLIGLLLVGTVIAFFTSMDNKANQITMGRISVEVEEKVEDGCKKNVGITVGEDSAKCWVRLYVGLPVGNDEKVLVQVEKSDSFDQWTDGEDGYFYYNTPIGGTGKKETVLLYQAIRSVEGLKKSEVPGELDIVVYAEAVQASFGATAQEAFAKLK